jgi:hypothetical protein
VDIDHRDKALAVDLVDDLLDVARGERVLVAVLERRVDAEVAGAFAERRAVAEDGEDDEVVLLGRLFEPLQRLVDVVLGGLSVARAAAEEQLGALLVDAEVLRDLICGS